VWGVSASLGSCTNERKTPHLLVIAAGSRNLISTEVSSGENLAKTLMKAAKAVQNLS